MMPQDIWLCCGSYHYLILIDNIGYQIYIYMDFVTQIIDISIYSDTINYILKDIYVVQFNCLCNLWLYVK